MVGTDCLTEVKPGLTLPRSRLNIGIYQIRPQKPPVSFSIDILLSARRMLGEMTDSLLRNCSRHVYLLLDDSMHEGRSLVSWLGQPKDSELLQIRWELSST